MSQKDILAEIKTTSYLMIKLFVEENRGVWIKTIPP